jgi:hypothetical protein
MINKQKLLQAFKADMKNAETMQKDWKSKRDEWLDESYGNPYGNEVDGKSKIVSKDIKKQLEWLIPSATDPFLSTSDVIKCNPVTYEDVNSAKQNELLLNTQFCRKFPRYNFVNKAVRVLATEGTVVIETGWEYEDKEIEEDVEVIAIDGDGVEYISIEKQTVTKVTKNQPTANVCRNEDIFIDPTCMDDIDKCQFVIHRYETDLSTLRSDGRYKNLKTVAKQEMSEDPDFTPEDITEFKFEDAARKKLIIHEYWGNYDVNDDGQVEQIVCSWVGNVVVRLETNPYPDGKPPFIVVPFNSIPFQLFGEALAENIGDNQKVKTAITRGIIDNMARSNNGQLGIRRGALSGDNRKKFLSGKNFEFNNTASDFWQGSYNQIPGSVFDMLSIQNSEIESQTGVKSFSGGITGNALGATATAARGVMDATAMRRLHLVRNLSENLMKPLMRKWMSYNAEFLEEEEIIRITNDDYVPIRKDDLEGRIDIEISISTFEDNAAKADQLSFMLQTLGNTLDPEITKILLEDIARLQRMPEIEKKIHEYVPQPDPLQEQIKQLEVIKLQKEIEKMDADIADKYARAGENDVDRILKQQKAMVEAAKARKLHSDADKIDLDFVDKDGGYQNLYESSEKEKDRQHQANMALLQKRLGGPNEQIGVSI